MKFHQIIRCHQIQYNAPNVQKSISPILKSKRRQLQTANKLTSKVITLALAVHTSIWRKTCKIPKFIFFTYEDAKKFIKRLLPTLRLPFMTTRLGVFFGAMLLDVLTHFFYQQTILHYFCPL